MVAKSGREASCHIYVTGSQALRRRQFAAPIGATDANPTRCEVHIRPSQSDHFTNTKTGITRSTSRGR